MKILIAGFKGKDNSAKILLDNIKEECNLDILYLENLVRCKSNFQ